jgi:hypothetical protein
LEAKPESLFETVWTDISCTIDLFNEDETKRLFLKSLLMGGTVSAEKAVINCTGLSRYWGDGDENKALGLTRLFFWMTFSYYHHGLKAGSGDAETELITIEEAARKLLPAFGKINEKDLQLYLNLDSQFNYDLENSPHLIHLASLLLAVSCEICGHRCLDWSKVSFPVKEMFHIAHRGAILDSEPLRDQQDLSEMQSALAAGIKTTNLYYEKV